MMYFFSLTFSKLNIPSLLKSGLVRCSLLLLLLCCFLYSLPSSAALRNLTINEKSDPPLKKIALVIGNSNYKDVVRLKNPVNDAKSMSLALNKLGFEVTELTDASQKDMNRAIGHFGRKLNADSVGLFYYAGHGLQVGGKNYLVPVDALIDGEASIPTETVEVDSVLAQLTTSALSIVILDACRNNPFERGSRSTAGGLAQIDAPKGSFIAFATSPGKSAADGNGKNGVYTTELLKQMSVPNLSIESVFKRVRANVARLTGDAQVPWESTSLVGDFYFQPDDSSAVEKAQQELAKKQEEAKRAEDLRKQELARKQEEDARRQQELVKKQEELKRAEDLRKQELVRKQEEDTRRQQELVKKQEELKRAENLRKQELARKQEEDTRRQQELVKKQDVGEKNMSSSKVAIALPNGNLETSSIIKAIEQVNTSNQWVYSYTNKLGAGGHEQKAVVTFTSLNLIKEGVKFKFEDTQFELTRSIPDGYGMVAAINPLTRIEFNEFAPFLLAGKDLTPGTEIKSKFRLVSVNSDFNDYSWNIRVTKVEDVKVEFNGTILDARKITISGHRPTGTQNCSFGGIGAIDAEIWYVKDIKRYIKQAVKKFTCSTNARGTIQTDETYSLLSFATQ
jgi:uncharacterized caspase-like protein